MEKVEEGDEVEGKVVEILMRDKGLDEGIIRIGKGLRIGKKIFVVEDIEEIVINRENVEIGEGEDIEKVKVILEEEFLIVKFNGEFKRVNRIKREEIIEMLKMDGEIEGK